MFGHCGTPQNVSATATYPLTLDAWWDATPGTMHITGHKARLTRRGP